MEIKLDLKQELHKGCPHACVFCNQRRISGTIKDTTVEDVDNIIKEYLDYYLNTDKKIEIAFFGGSFTGIDLSLQEAYLKVAYKYIIDGKVDSIRLSTRPDYINDEILTLLTKYGVKTIELGVQSMNDEILDKAKRGHTRDDVINASNLIRQYGIRLGHQIMIGLPYSSINSEVYTIKECLKLEPEQLRIYPVYVIEDSELYDMYEAGEYKALEIGEAVDRCVAVIHECQKTNVQIIRLGLQSTSEITAKNANIYGPVSDNFAEYVMAALIRERIENEIVNKDGDIVVYVPKRYISATIGPKKINKIYFENKFNVKYIVKGED